MSVSDTRRHRDGWVALGMTISATSAALSSFAGLRDLAGFAGWHPYMAPLLPLTVDSLALTSIRIALTAGAPRRARRLAGWTSLTAVLLSLVGNAADHLVAARLLAVTWPLVLAVGAVPPLVLAAVVHLAVLRTEVNEAGLVPEPSLARSTGTALEAVPRTEGQDEGRSPVRQGGRAA